MKNKLSKTLFLALAIIGLSACSNTYTPNSNVTNLSDVDFDNIKSLRKGTDCGYNILFVGPIGNATLIDATRDGRINRVKYVEKNFSGFPFTYVPLVSKQCIIVYGE